MSGSSQLGLRLRNVSSGRPSVRRRTSGSARLTTSSEELKTEESKIPRSSTVP